MELLIVNQNETWNSSGKFLLEMASSKSSQTISERSQQELSQLVYVELCLKIGTTEQIANRRGVMDVWDILRDIYRGPNQYFSVTNGSHREGFRCNDSDVDSMWWPKDHRVLWDFSQAKFYKKQRFNLILCDSSESPPGFTLLLLPLERPHAVVLLSCVRMNRALYISSAKYKRTAGTGMCYLIHQHVKVHGPCSSGIIGVVEYDYAHGFVSDFWPPAASSWKGRCQSWPPPSIVEDIVKSGCHFVAIGHKHGIHEDNEWRISFSQAEQKLVYAMNHTQFLTYGMLKLFVKKFNNRFNDEEKILCSYHMKTAIFWTIQQNTMTHWCPQNLLAGFWDCFKLLLKWIYEGICPNFFIPENNMFLNKVHGMVQTNLFNRLYDLYEKGITYLLQSFFGGTYIDAQCNSTFSVCTDERALISEAKLDKDLFYEIHTTNSIAESLNLNSCIKRMRAVEQLIRLPWTKCQIIMLQKYASKLFQTLAYLLHVMHTNPQRVNKRMYITDKISCFMLKLTGKFGFVSDLLYIAMYYYKTFRYREALSVIDKTKVKLSQPCLMCYDLVNEDEYEKAVGGQSWSNKMRRVVALSTDLNNRICYIKELLPEQFSGLQDKVPLLIIPPHITLHMLEFLCCRHEDPLRAQTALNDLQVLVHNDKGVFVPVEHRDISWQILGICQQITGNHQDALDSYKQSLRQVPFNKIQNATRFRIHNLSLQTY